MAALTVPPVQRRVAVKLGSQEVVHEGARVQQPVMLEAHNPEGGRCVGVCLFVCTCHVRTTCFRAGAELVCSSSGRVLWRDHIGGQVVQIAGSLRCAGVATMDGGLQV